MLLGTTEQRITNKAERCGRRLGVFRATPFHQSRPAAACTVMSVLVCTAAMIPADTPGTPPGRLTVTFPFTLLFGRLTIVCHRTTLSYSRSRPRFSPLSTCCLIPRCTIATSSSLPSAAPVTDQSTPVSVRTKETVVCLFSLSLSCRISNRPRPYQTASPLDCMQLFWHCLSPQETEELVPMGRQRGRRNRNLRPMLPREEYRF